MCVRPCLCLCLCVCFSMITQKEIDLGTRNWSTLAVYKNSSDKFDIEHCQIKVKVTLGVQKFPHLPQYKLSGPITQLWYKIGSLY